MLSEKSLEGLMKISRNFSPYKRSTDPDLKSPAPKYGARFITTQPYLPLDVFPDANDTRKWNVFRSHGRRLGLSDQEHVAGCHPSRDGGPASWSA
jgi:hypothetical protein